MTQLTSSKVEFFNSQSSFGSSSVISTSRLDFVGEELISDVQEVFDTLKSFLIPREDLVNQEKLQHIIHRARILYNDTIPDHLRRLPKSNRSLDHCDNIEKETKRLAKLIDHYESYKKTSLAYQHFYEYYGGKTVDFRKIKSFENQVVPIQPDVVHIIEQSRNKNSRLLQKATPAPTNRNYQKDREVLELQQEIIQLKKKQKTLICEFETSQRNLKRQSEIRIQSILNMYKPANTENDKILILQNALQQTQQNYQNQVQSSIKSKSTILLIEKEVQELSYRNKLLQQQIEESNRRLGNSRMSQDSDGGKSVKSQFEGALGNQNKKLYKKIRNLEYENSILKNELNKEREELHKLRKREANEIENDSTRLRKALETKTQQILQLKTELDKYKVQNIKLTDKLQKSNASIELAKLSHTESPKISIHSPIPNLALTSNGFAQSLADSSRNLQNKGSKNNIGTYIGDGNEHYPYYQLLNKQFKIRFKRACLKQKELLHKANGLEIGVITEFIEPNQIKIHLHFSNFCDQQPIKGLKIKVSNAKNNKIILQKSYIDHLKVGEQVKQMLTIQIKNYPIGCTALLCEYSYYNRTQEVRVLLPSHVFKMLQIKPRDDQYRSPIEHTLTPQKKIVKDFATLSNYFKNSLVQNNTIKMTMFHNATETKFLVDISYVNHQVHIKYQHRAGDEAITQYVIKTISFLIKKDTLV